MKLPCGGAKVWRNSQRNAMKSTGLVTLQVAALTLACLRGIGEFASLQRWRLRERFARHHQRG
jgi:hypothetical protein